MPVVMRFAWGKVHVVVYTNDHLPPHVHVKAPGAKMKLRIADLAIMGKAHGFDASTIKRIVTELERHKDYLQEQWDDFHDEE